MGYTQSVSIAFEYIASWTGESEDKPEHEYGPGPCRTLGGERHTRRIIQKQQGRLDEQRLRQRNSHSPSSRHILRLLVDGLLVESETSEDDTGSDLERRRVLSSKLV